MPFLLFKRTNFQIISRCFPWPQSLGDLSIPVFAWEYRLFLFSATLRFIGSCPASPSLPLLSIYDSFRFILFNLAAPQVIAFWSTYFSACSKILKKKNALLPHLSSDLIENSIFLVPQNASHSDSLGYKVFKLCIYLIGLIGMRSNCGEHSSLLFDSCWTSGVWLPPLALTN